MAFLKTKLNGQKIRGLPRTSPGEEYDNILDKRAKDK